MFCFTNAKFNINSVRKLTYYLSTVVTKEFDFVFKYSNKFLIYLDVEYILGILCKHASGDAWLMASRFVCQAQLTSIVSLGVMYDEFLEFLART